MTFTLTREYLDKIATAAAKGDIQPFIDSIDPNVKWRIGASDEKGTGREGVYVSQPLSRAGLASVGDWTGDFKVAGG
jgi:hypothetical protein